MTPSHGVPTLSRGTHGSVLVFANPLHPQSVDELDAVARDQVRRCGEQWDGDDLPVEARLHPTDTIDDANFYLQMLARWDVLDGGRHAYDAWFFAVDSGVVFRARTTEVVCVVVQFDFQADDPALAAALGDAARRAGAI